MKSSYVVGGMVVGAVGLFLLASHRVRSSQRIDDVQIDPDFGKHRGLAPMYAGPDQLPYRHTSAQDPKGGAVDYLSYPYKATEPSAYAKGEPAQHTGSWWDKSEDRWKEIPFSPIDYGRPPLRIPKLFKDYNRYWDGLTSYGGTDVVGQKVHLFHLRPSYPTRGIRSISGSLSEIGGGMSTASRARIPAVFVPSVLS